jgi:hypothetical protein
VPDTDDLNLFGGPAERVCRSCWRIVEVWLTAPPPAEGDDEVAHWVANAGVEDRPGVDRGGASAPCEGALRRRARSEIKAAIGGSVRTALVGRGALWVRSGLEQDAKTPEHRQDELRSAVERRWNLEAGHPVEPARWPRHRRDISEID